MWTRHWHLFEEDVARLEAKDIWPADGRNCYRSSWHGHRSLSIDHNSGPWLDDEYRLGLFSLMILSSLSRNASGCIFGPGCSHQLSTPLLVDSRYPPYLFPDLQIKLTAFPMSCCSVWPRWPVEQPTTTTRRAPIIRRRSFFLVIQLVLRSNHSFASFPPSAINLFMITPIKKKPRLSRNEGPRDIRLETKSGRISPRRLTAKCDRT